MQLVAYGAQDIYLTGNPQITFFKVVYRRHTNFSMESIEQTFNGSADWGKKVSATISRNGDLIHKVYLEVDVETTTGGTQMTAKASWVKRAGYALIKEVEVEIGGQRIDKHYGVWMQIWSELSSTKNQELLLDKLVGGDAINSNANQAPSKTWYVPLQFWFCKNPGCALPLIALQYHEVKINITFRPIIELLIASDNLGAHGAVSFNASLYVDYIYLDTDERRRFAQVSHEYLIEQLQFTGEETLRSSHTLNFNHPVKELVWVSRLNSATTVGTANTNTGENDWFNFTNSGSNPTDNVKLQLNGHDRFSERKAGYFNWVQPYQHHTGCPSVGVNVYSFGLTPEEHQPSGTCNMSRIDNASMKFGTAAGSCKVSIFAVNYNVLRIMSGMGGLAYSN
jgi:hypothetical protein